MTNYRRRQLALRSLPQSQQNTLVSGKLTCTWSQVFFALSIILAFLVVASAVMK